MIDDCAVLACDVAVRRALEIACKRMLTRSMLSLDLRHVPAWQRYVRYSRVTDPARQTQLLDGAWDSLPTEMSGWTTVLDEYVRRLLVTGEMHTADTLRLWVQDRTYVA